MTILPGTGIIVAGSPGGPYTISSIDTFTQEKTAEDPPEQKTADTPEETFKSGSGTTIASSGGLAGALGGLGGVISILGGGAGITGIASSAIGAVGGLSGALTGGSLVGGFIGIWGHERKQEKDEDDNGLYNEDGTASLEEGSNVVIATLPDVLGCETTRLLFDKPPPCSWLGLQNEYGQQAVNLQILREYDTEVILPKIVSTTSALLEPLSEQLEITNLICLDIESNINNNFQPKITSSAKLDYSLISNTPNLSIYATSSSVASTKHPLITSSAKLDYSLLSNTPDLNPYLTRTTDLNSINASIATKQNTITNSFSLSGLDTTSTTLLNENFNSAAPTAWGQTSSSGTLTYTIPNLGRYWTLNSSLNYGSQNDDGIQITCGGWMVQILQLYLFCPYLESIGLMWLLNLFTILCQYM
ncbi:hypothetical protein DFS34DRAFT_611031 [Phlyctochytrium arcticum]|nr:hypothetical protein DFS34DRAFT_611031 [Phlyctochytrium arcticum]